MERKSDSINLCKSFMTLEDRKKLSLTGVDEVLGFDEEKIILNTILGRLKINGQGLKMNKLDVKNGDVTVEGYISSIIYQGKAKKKHKKLNIKKLIGRE
ncbi:sporulation protein YabP [Clostridium sp.]|uniref:sporulation protein YabP n=1 Tax=Clostridium sp. TaxID=1506 RepID=UPI0026DDB3DA|nr:sporulation protein YabP [Clostridium sp.]MDO5038384.1 sporulation protein YabP [Clostridium sp.]